ncbi:uncharacterized protein EAF01_002993 [Botrytis porri]|uniref:uncharacterized protein n=1 Tax=Botrytis porri TaxID=87229 RepID=UPI001901D6CB|nr:uncharacterized protein EAF01_002993 [Botrytis porri]KAF7911486.1 hypothetical protein EAF01_002993 [Botrytis porri]
MLSGRGGTKIITSEILSRLDFVEITLLSCAIIVGQPLLDRQTSKIWTKREKKAFRRNDGVGLLSVLGEILGGWEQLLKFLVHEVDIWRPEACCNMVWEAGHQDGTYLESLADLEHRNRHRIFKATRMELQIPICFQVGSNGLYTECIV